MQGWQYGKGLIYLGPIFRLTSCIFEKDKKTSWIIDLFILRRRCIDHLSLEGTRKGYLFCQKWYTDKRESRRGLDLDLSQTREVNKN